MVTELLVINLISTSGIKNEVLCMDNKSCEQSYCLLSIVTNNFYGEVGKPTNYKDKYERPLFVGDVVKLKGVIKDIQFVVSYKGKDFIMGAGSACDDKTDIIKNFEVTLVVPFTELRDNMGVGVIAVAQKYNI